MMKQYLLTPGPTPVPPEVSLKSALPVIHHRTSEFSELFQRVLDNLQYLFETKNDVLVFASSGTGVMESCVVNLLSPDDKVLVLDTGVFGARWEKIIKSFGIEPVIIKEEWGNAVDVAKVKKALKENKDIKAVFTQLTETSTGVVNDIKSLGALVRDMDCVLVVDAISGLGAQEMKTDEWNVDVTVTGSQKGLMLPPGLAMVSVSAKAWAMIEKSKLPKFYWDYKAYRKAHKEKKQAPYTPAVTLIVAADEALQMIKKEGLQNILARHDKLARATRAGINALGLEIFAKEPCNAVTSVNVPDGVDGKLLVKKLRQEFGVSVAGGQQHLAGKIFRIAHLGYMDRFDTIVGLAALEMGLTELGYKVQLGKAVAASEEIFLK